MAFKLFTLLYFDSPLQLLAFARILGRNYDEYIKNIVAIADTSIYKLSFCDWKKSMQGERIRDLPSKWIDCDVGGLRFDASQFHCDTHQIGFVARRFRCVAAVSL